MIERAYKKLVVTAAGGRATLCLNNEARKNAIGPLMVNELLYALEDADADPEVRVVVLTGAGNAFSAGGDFSSMQSGDGEELPHKGDFADLLLRLARFEKPLVARVNGVAMGGGLGLVASCHFAVAVDSAKLGTPEIDVGLFPMMIMAVLARLVPRRQLLSMMLLGEKFSAEEALRLGLLSQVVAAAELDSAVDALVGRLAAKSPIATRLGLRAHAATQDLSLEAALPDLRDRLMACLATEDAREGLMAFLEKRPPAWKGC
jgi:enoyl-CoA hydratase/carnithine racemase